MSSDDAVFDLSLYHLTPMPAGHFIYIPAILLLGLVAGWILGSRAAADAYAAELRRREQRAAKKRAAAVSGRG
ncbi:MAG: hypothetical protein CL484_05085 [Acidobacteria bacterium]|nr:hypothetical protein [Acidobacteriota bacterium]